MMKTSTQNIRNTIFGTMRLAMVLMAMAMQSAYAQQTCALDIHIANDQSGSIDAVENSQGKTFVRKLAQSINLGTGETGNRIAVSNWANTNTWEQYNFPSAGKNYTTNVSDLISYANSRQTIFGGTDPYQALQKAYSKINITPIAGRTAPKVIVLMTDAYCSQVQAGITTLASQIKGSGIYIMVLALDDATKCSKLQGTNVASPGMYLSGGSYSNLQNNAISILQNLINSLCSGTSKAWDLKIALDAAKCNTGTATYTVDNVGTAVFNGPLHVSFYNGDPTLPTTKLLTSTSHTGQTIAPGSSTSLSYTSPSLAGVGKLFAVVNIDPANAAPPLAYNLSNVLAVSGEGGATNNMSGVFTATGCPTTGPVLEVSKVFAGIDCNRHAVYNVQVCNTSAVDATDVLITDYPSLESATLISSTSNPSEAPLGPNITRTYNLPTSTDGARNGYDGSSSGPTSTILNDYAMGGHPSQRVGWNFPIGAKPIPKNAVITSAKFIVGAVGYAPGRTQEMNVKATFRTTDIPFNNTSADGIWNEHEKSGATVKASFSYGDATPVTVDVTSLVQAIVNNTSWSTDGNIIMTGSFPADNGGVVYFKEPNGFPASLEIKYRTVPTATLPAGQCITTSYTYDMSTGTTGTTYQNSAGVTTSTANATILPNNAPFSVGSTNGIRGYNGAVNTGDEFKMPAPCTQQPARPITTSVDIEPTEVCGGGGNFVTATVTISNPNTMSMYNALQNLNLTGAGSTYGGEPYDATNGLSLAQANVLDPNYPSVPNALYGKSGSQELTIYQIPPGTSTFKIDLSAGTATFNLASTISNLPTKYNSTGKSNTASDAQAVKINKGPTLNITTASCGSAVPFSTTNISLTGTATNSVNSTWTSGTSGLITNTGSASAPAGTYTISDQDRANGYVNITLMGVSSAGCDNATSCRIGIEGATYDFGDAPSSYDYDQSTTTAAGGAMIKSSNIFFGALAPDAESVPMWGTLATSDDNDNIDDEDGVAAFTVITEATKSYTVNFSATNTSSTASTAIAWIDWDNNGTFEPSEASEPVSVPAGTVNGSFVANWSDVSTTAVSKYARFRIASNLTIYDYVGATNDGEVEDYVIEADPLPVKLTKFSVSKEENMAILNWSTTEEINSESFEIQHSLNGKEWKKIGSVAAKGESKELADYRFTHHETAGGENLYRLKMLDRDASYSFSRIRSVWFEQTGLKLNLYPNPVSDYLYVQDVNGQVITLDKVKEVSIINIHGVTVYNSTSQVSAKGIDMSGLGSGIYLVKIILTDGTYSTHKVAVER
ncbi:GEVED domain-containing protein [Dyadobacter tibetensis]|uniref:GEVED domain-containing protein n=1 Tax=Dyadobacter tibetensis TaxID=1211851 RepID=UPI0004AD21FF|nr:GEVED domain-containing protein [Dyadobacter tibetensis]